MERCYRDNRLRSNRQSASLFNAISTQTMAAANFITETERRANVRLHSSAGNDWAIKWGKWEKIESGNRLMERDGQITLVWMREWKWIVWEKKETSMLVNTEVSVQALNRDLRVEGVKIKHNINIWRRTQNKRKKTRPAKMCDNKTRALMKADGGKTEEQAGKKYT